MPKYPDITVQLTGKDGNAFYILGICLRAILAAGNDPNSLNCEHFIALAKGHDHFHSVLFYIYEICQVIKPL